MPLEYLISQLEFYLVFTIGIVAAISYTIFWYRKKSCANCLEYVSDRLYEHSMLLGGYEKLLHNQFLLHDYQLSSVLHSLNDLEKIRGIHAKSGKTEIDKLIEYAYEILRINYKNFIIENKGEIQDQTIAGIVQSILELGIMKSYSRDDLLYQGFDRLFATVQKKVQVSGQPTYTSEQIRKIFMDTDL